MNSCTSRSGRSFGTFVSLTLLFATLCATPPATAVAGPSGDPAPQLDRVTPNRLLPGTSRRFTLQGSGLQDGGSAQLRNPAGVSIDLVTWTSDSTVLLDITASADAALGARGLVWSNPDGQTASLKNAIRVGSTPMGTSYTFTDVTVELGVENAEFGHFGVTWSDYDKDGWLDLYAANGEQPQPFGPEDINTLYHNNGDGTFTDVTAETGAGDPWVAMRNVWADYDRDGDLDFYSHNFVHSTLYQNNGNVFTDVNDSSGAGLDMPNGTGACWADFDNDGWLDLHATSFSPQNEDWQVLFHNNGDGTFTDIREAAGMPFIIDGMGNACSDYDFDGDIDIFVAAVTPTDGNVLYESRFAQTGEIAFELATASVGIVLEEGSSGSAVTLGDYDNDGFFDLLFTEVNLGSQKVLPTKIYLFRNLGDGTFADVTAAAGLVLDPTAAEHWHASWADYDNDADLDLFIGSEGPNAFFRNNGDGTFTDIAAELGLDYAEEGKGAAWGDYDNDGDLDVYIIQHVEPGNTRVPNHLLRNDGGPNNWLQLELTGVCSNLDAIGARITVRAAGVPLQRREIAGGTGFFDQHTPIQQFGLGAATQADEVVVRWPSGTVQRLANVAANQRLPITEPASCAD